MPIFFVGASLTPNRSCPRRGRSPSPRQTLARGPAPVSPPPEHRGFTFRNFLCSRNLSADACILTPSPGWLEVLVQMSRWQAH